MTERRSARDLPKQHRAKQSLFTNKCQRLAWFFILTATRSMNELCVGCNRNAGVWSFFGVSPFHPKNVPCFLPKMHFQVVSYCFIHIDKELYRTWPIPQRLGCPPSQDSSGTWRFIRISHKKWNNPTPRPSIHCRHCMILPTIPRFSSSIGRF